MRDWMDSPSDERTSNAHRPTLVLGGITSTTAAPQYRFDGTSILYYHKYRGSVIRCWLI